MRFYELLDAQADAAFRAAVAFQDMASDFGRIEEHTAKISTIEREADDVTHEMSNRLDATFVTPLDKEDLRGLSAALDDITDIIEAGAHRAQLYRLREPRPDLDPLLGLLVRTVDSMREVVAILRNLRSREEVNRRFIKVHELENEADRAYRMCLARLFDAPDADALMVMKWKDIYDRIEMAVDKCEDVAKMVESVAVKYA